MELDSQISNRMRNGDDDDADCSSRDLLSALPDCLLHDILSRLKAQQVVQTSVLSSRWCSLWRSVPCLDVDQDEFKVAVAGGDGTSTQECWHRFERFADHLLIRRNVGIALLDTFRLSIGDPRFAVLAARWIRHIIKYGTVDHHRRPLAAETNASWTLKTLRLSNVSLDDRLSKHIRSRCPSLEDVELKGCMCDMDQIASGSLKKLLLQDCDCSRLVAITSPKLERLVINGGCIAAGGRGPLVVAAPALAYLAVLVSNTKCPGGVHVEETPSLAQAFVDLWGNTVAPLGQNMPGINYYKLLDSVSSVTALELARVVTVEPPVFPEFKNLRALSVSVCTRTVNLEMLLCHFLQSSPNLEILSVHYCMASCPAGAEIHSEKPRITEIMYKEEEDLLQQVKLMLGSPRDTYIVRLTKVDPLSLDSSQLPLETFTWGVSGRGGRPWYSCSWCT